jgi:hypothetical protein
MRGPNDGTGTSSGHWSALSTAWWWQIQHYTASDRTPFSRMLPRVREPLLKTAIYFSVAK